MLLSYEYYELANIYSLIYPAKNYNLSITIMIR